MSQEQLTNDMSNLSLQNNGQPPVGNRKSRRPNRAYHNVSAVSTPVVNSGPTMGMPPLHTTDSSNSLHQNQSFTPIPFNPSQMNASSPLINGMNSTMENNQFTPNVSSPNGYANTYEELNTSTSSHIIASERWQDQTFYLTETVPGNKHLLPPLSTTEFYCIDQGSCDPRFMNLTMYNIPENEHLRSATKLPLGLTIQPFAQVMPEEPVPIASRETVLTKDGQEEFKEPLRCKRCRAYVNPGFKMGYDSSAICNICQVKMKLPMDNFNSMDITGQNESGNFNIASTKATVDFFVPKVYNAVKDKDPVPLHYIFMIDVSSLANENGSSIAMLEAVRSSIDYISENQPKCKIALIAYDNKIRFYNLKPELETAQEFIINEINDVFLPFYSGLFVQPQESMKVINDTLKKIADYISFDKYSQVPQACYGSALEAAKIALTTVTGGQGGKIICSLNSLPTAGNGNLMSKRDDATKKTLQSDNEFYQQISNTLMRSYISVDLYITSAGFCDMINVAKPVQMTGGTLKYYPHFQPEQYETVLINDMLTTISRIQGYQALLKLRTSAGLSVESYYLENVEYGSTDPILPVLSNDSCIDVLLRYDDKLKAGTDTYFQAAILFTDIHGIRKVRSINATAMVSANVPDVFKRINQDTITRIMIKDVIRTLGNCDFAAIRQAIDNKLVEIYTQYRAIVSGNSSSQLVLPNRLMTLPMYMLAFEKSNLMKPNLQSTRGNDRVYDLFKYQSFNPAKLNFKLYPQIIPFHVLLENKDLTFYDVNEKMLRITPDSLANVSVQCAHAKLDNGGCYFIFNGETIYLWFNENTNQMLLQDLLGVDPSLPINAITLYSGSLPETGTQINEKAANMIKYWCHITGQTSIAIRLLRPNIDQYYSLVSNELLCEDRSINMIESHDNYLNSLHRKIQEKLNKDDYIKVSGSKNHETFHQKFVQF